MPLYEYQCKECGKKKEELANYEDPPPKCCKKNMKRGISRTSFSLKGDGWYKDHYGLKKGKSE